MKLNIARFTLPIKYDVIEEKYGAKYLGDFCLKGKNGWNDNPSAIFFQPNPNLELGHSTYFAITAIPIYKENFEIETYRIYIQKGDSAVMPEFIGMKCGDEIVISCYRHDMRHSINTPAAAIDGGRDYQLITYSSDEKTEELVKVDIFKDEFWYAGELLEIM